MLPETTPVLVVGAGPVGLATAAFLGWHGIEALVAERRPSGSGHPRARGVSPRTMELLRGLGLEERVRGTRSARDLADNDGIVVAETLAGRQLKEMSAPYFMFGALNYTDLGPSPWCMCHQDELEPILLDRARELGADVAFGAECVELRQDATGVDAVLRTDSGQQTVRAQYVIAADGAGSPTRTRLRVPMSGPGRLGHFLNIQFEADLRDALGDRRFIMCYIAGAGVRCALLPVDNAERWMLHVMCEPEEVPDFTEERCADLVRAAAGVPDLDVRIRSALPWESAGRVADRWRHGRVFLTGDAAHTMPPTGAFGSNTGIQDGHNLAWKLAAVLRGRAADALLDTYEEERLPVARETMRQAVARSQDRPGAESGKGGPSGIVPDPVVVLGYRYRSAAVAAEPGDDAGNVWENRPTGSPGARVPYVPLPDGSTVDLVRRRFVLFAGADTAGLWQDAADECDRALGIPFDVHVMGSGSGWPEAAGVTSSGAVLVRPDGFVAWRSTDVPEDIGRTFTEVVARLLGRPAPAEPVQGDQADQAEAGAVAAGAVR
ncbi:FAD-dependent monooxygenase [Actinomadura rupiterrae]|uniref:FAD-dependent monooxygenase n=1 Tax=Actinomadura rupiterrae TaxID=559627 RepID=UPI0020A53A0A|nr:FAD-dependent monooxygenase [Actinomadura rupiterrae]MCP2341065.1 putative polyketide hydroxylase [Actinomadura rupiterrae]